MKLRTCIFAAFCACLSWKHDHARRTCGRLKIFVSLFQVI